MKYAFAIREPGICLLQLDCPVCKNSSWSGYQSVHVPREQDRLPHVGKAEHSHDQSLGPKAPARVGRHAVSERAKVELEVIGVETFPPDLLHELVIPVLPLGPTRELHPRVHQIERLADRGIVLVPHRIVGPDLTWPVYDEIMPAHLGTNRPLGRRTDVIAVLDGILDLLLRDLDRFAVREPGERGFREREVRNFQVCEWEEHVSFTYL